MSFSISANMRSFPLASQLGSTSPFKLKSAEEEFLEIAKKSPLERMRDKIMEDMKVDQDSIAKMSPEQQQAVEDEIKRRVMEALQASTDSGQVVDKKA